MTGTSHTSTSEDAATDSLDAAQLLLGVAPASAPGWPNCGEFSIISREDGDSSVSVDYSKNCSASGNIKGQLPWEYSLLQLRKATSCKFEFSIEQMTTDAGAEEMCPTNQGLRLPTTSGLDALAILASNAVSMKTDIPSIHDLKTNDRNLSTCDERTDDSVGQRRGRSVSNPEGMDKWSTLLSRAASSRLHYIQPTIAEESTSDVMAPCTSAMNEGDPARSKRVNFIEEDDHRNCDTEVEEEVEEVNCLTLEQIKAASFADLDIILRRARGKLLEDWVTGNATTNVQCLPHTLAKYQNVYNKNGRVGIYKPAERAAIIARFHSKRTRRVWNKKIRYSCRKNLADRRLRVKGRFVRRSLNDAMIADAAAAKQETTACHPLSDPPQAVELSISSASSGSEEDSSPRSSSPIQNSERHGSIDVDDDMPDVEVREAGFAPTGDQPFRRARRHTIA